MMILPMQAWPQRFVAWITAFTQKGAHANNHAPVSRCMPLHRARYWAIIPLTHMVYVPINKVSASLEPHVPALWIDRVTPLVAEGIHLYVLVFFIGGLATVTIMDLGMVKRVVMACALMQLFAFACFLIFPVHMVSRPQSVTISSLSTWGLGLCYWIDAPSNCFPSLHVALPTLATLSIGRISRTRGTVSGLLTLGVAVSTMLIKQHFFVDVVAGAFLGIVTYLLFVARYPMKKAVFQHTVPRNYPGMLIAVYGVAYFVLITAYQLGWAPWAPM